MLAKLNQFFSRTYRQVTNDIDATLLALLAFFLPFERIPSTSVFGVTLRPSLFIAAAIIVRAGYLIITKRRTLQINWPIKLLFLFLIWLILIIPAAINYKRAFEVTIFTGFTAFTAVSISLTLKKAHLTLIFKALITSTVLVCLFGLYQYFGNIYGLSHRITGILQQYSWEQFGFPRIQSTTLEPLYFASFLLLPIAWLVVVVSFAGKKRAVNEQLLIILFLVSASLFLTVSRGGILAIAVLAIAWLITMKVFDNFRLKKIAAILMTLVLAYGASYIMIKYINKPASLTFGKHTGTEAYNKQIANFGLQEGRDERAIARRQALALFKTSPLIGVGPGQYGPHEQNNIKAPSGWTIVNNEPIELLTETGIIGFIIFIAFAVTLFALAARQVLQQKDRQLKIALLALMSFLVAIAAQYQTFSTLYIMHIWVAIGLLLGLIGLSSKARAKANT